MTYLLAMRAPILPFLGDFQRYAKHDRLKD